MNLGIVTVKRAHSWVRSAIASESRRRFNAVSQQRAAYRKRRHLDALKVRLRYEREYQRLRQENVALQAKVDAVLQGVVRARVVYPTPDMRLALRVEIDPGVVWDTTMLRDYTPYVVESVTRQVGLAVAQALSPIGMRAMEAFDRAERRKPMAMWRGYE